MEVDEIEIQTQVSKFQRVPSNGSTTTTDNSTNPQRIASYRPNLELQQWPSSRIVRVSRASGGKDRHSKVLTSKGLRDRRVRLSVNTAIQFYDLQDRLGFDQPSKAVEWLLKAAASSIDELPSLDPPFLGEKKPETDQVKSPECSSASSKGSAPPPVYSAPSTSVPGVYFLQFQQPAYVKNFPENAIEGYPNNRRRRNNYSNTRTLSNGRALRAQREDSIKRTVYVSDIDHNVSQYEKELEIMQNTTKEEYLATLRRRSSGFSRGTSKYRGIARHHHNGRWEARIGRVFGKKYLYLGTLSSQFTLDLVGATKNP